MFFNTLASDEITPSQHAANKYLDLRDAHSATLKAQIHHGKESDEYKAAHSTKENAFKAHEEATSKLNSAEKHMHRMGIESGWHHRTPTSSKQEVKAFSTGSGDGSGGQPKSKEYHEGIAKVAAYSRQHTATNKNLGALYKKHKSIKKAMKDPSHVENVSKRNTALNDMNKAASKVPEHEREQWHNEAATMFK